MIPTRLAVALAMAFSATCAWADHPPLQKDLGVVTVTGGQPTSLPTQIPTTVESITRGQIEQAINAADSEDALKYFPSLLVRKRYIGDYNHAILSSRASGTGNSARSAVYADGILLSNFLGNGVGGLAFPPRWGLVTPEEIDRVDVMYGPFSAAYPGNSVGAVVDYVTRMPTRFEAHAQAGYSSQPFDLYGTHATFNAWQASASAGNRGGDWSWFFNVSHTDSHGQPLTFATRLASAGTAPAGALPGRNNANVPWYVVASQTEYTTRQDHLKAKLAYDVTPVLRATYVLGVWRNDAEGVSHSYVAAPLVLADLPQTRESLRHAMHGFTLKQHTQGVFDWEVAASRYDYSKDGKRQNSGTLADGSGTGWQTLALKGTWRPAGAPHVVDFGVQQDSFRLAYVTSAVPGDWTAAAPAAVISDVGGRTHLRSAWAQDVWSLAPRWKAVLGARAETWTADEGHTLIAPAVNTAWPSRSESHVSPKLALSWQWLPDTVVKASTGRALRFPTVAELYGGTSTVNSLFINDPNLKPERSWTRELSVEKDVGNAVLRATAFSEDTHDALYSQALFDAAANRNVTRVQNVGLIRTRGIELAYSGAGVVWKQLDVNASATYADSHIRENAGFVAVPGDTIGKRQPNIPRLRAAALASYRWDDGFSTSVGARYSSRQFRTLDNSDVDGGTYMGVSRFFVVDLRARWRIDRNWTAAIGIDNIGNDTYWNFHPYPQRTYTAELKVDL
ncbi:TonB-dependent receptor [Ramlibacter sp. PS4R-6]|uniref:TonB-dependent receptor n=1 Tax=Ramlibacter sp. PS4R-6 TaxID=3133438 RepID=UPI0030ACEFCC